VLLDERTLAMLHGCIGPLFFAVTVALVVFTSKCWVSVAVISSDAMPVAAIVRTLAVVTCVLVYLQLVFGAVLRHVPVDGEPGAFMLAVRFHLFLAGVLTLHVVLLAWLTLRNFRAVQPLSRLVLALCGLIVVQLLLGGGTWIVKFAVPAWAAPWLPISPFAIQADGWLQTNVITAHVAVGSLMLATSAATALYALRSLAAGAAPVRQTASGKIGVAT
jgi:cytochrome c oxidase assembly protein subunit 15